MAGVRVRVIHKLKTNQVKKVFRVSGPVYAHTFKLGVSVANSAKIRLGQAPQRIDTGRLRNSIGVKKLTQGVEVPGVTVGTNVEYAPFVHDGTRYMQANPFLADAIIDNIR